MALINADFITGEVWPAVYAVALMFGGLTQLIAD